MSAQYEYSLLGNYLQNPDLFDEVAHLVRPQLFTSDWRREAYKIIKDAHLSEKSIDGVILYRQLSQRFEKNKLTDYTCIDPSYIGAKQVKQYVEDLFRDYASNFLKNQLAEAVKNLDAQNVYDYLGKVRDTITTIDMVVNNVSKEKSIFDFFDEAIKDIEDYKSGKIDPLVFSWGIKALDRKTSGVVAGPNLVAATPGGGKTSLIINLAVQNCIKHEEPFLFFSLEMKGKDLMKNLFANITEINSRAIREGQIDDDQLQRVRDIKKTLKENFEIDETDGITWQQVEVKLRAFRKRRKIPLNKPILACIDFIQKMKNVPEEMRMLSKEERVETIANELARMAKEQNVHLIEISQFSRETSKREVPRPKLTDLKGSAAIEQNAVAAILLFRPEMHGIENENGRDLRGLCEMNIAKGRFVNPEPVYVRFVGKYSKFYDLDAEEDVIYNKSDEAPW